MFWELDLVIVNITHKSLTAFLAGVRNGVYAWRVLL